MPTLSWIRSQRKRMRRDLWQGRNPVTQGRNPLILEFKGIQHLVFDTPLLLSPIQSCDAKRIRRPTDVTEAALTHAVKHFFGRRKTFYRSGQVRIRALHPRNQGADLRQHVFEVNPVQLADHAARFSEIQDAAFSCGAEHADDFAQARLIVGQVAETEGGADEIKPAAGKWQV